MDIITSGIPCIQIKQQQAGRRGKGREDEGTNKTQKEEKKKGETNKQTKTNKQSNNKRRKT